MAFDKTIYVSKSGNDSNDGLTSLTPKLTLTGAKAITITGENLINIGVGEYTENVNWDGAGKYITLYGDYNAAIFGGSSGEVIIRRSTSYDLTYARQIERIVLKLSGAYLTMIKGSSGGTQELTFLYCVFRADALNTTYFIESGVNFYFSKVIIDHCSQDTNNMTLSSSGTFGPMYSKFYWYNFDNITSGKHLNNLDSISWAYYENCNILYYNCFNYNRTSNIYATGCTFKQYQFSSKFFSPTGVTNTVYSRKGSIYLRDCTLLDNSGNNLDIFNNYYFNYTILSGSNPYAYFVLNHANSKVTASQMYYFQNQTNKLLMYNTNSNAKNVLCLAGGVTIDGDTETYDSKDVLYYHGKIQNYIVPIVLPLLGLTAGNSYTVSFYYKKMQNNTSSSYDVRVGILKGSQDIQTDLYTTPASALTYADYTASTHTYDTWYSKTLTFTAAADTDEYYNNEWYLVLYMNSTVTNFKITRPTIAIS